MFTHYTSVYTDEVHDTLAGQALWALEVAGEEIEGKRTHMPPTFPEDTLEDIVNYLNSPPPPPELLADPNEGLLALQD